jgi:tRNA1Val (adenine37-N6)-methyltransferase
MENDMENDMQNDMLHENERIDDLQLNGLRIIQNPKGFCFGIDAVVLSHFINLKRNDIAVEFGTGTGIIPILLSGKTSFKKILAFEVQEKVANMAKRSILLNHLEDKIEIINDNLRQAPNYFKPQSVNVVFSNPPYMSTQGGIKNPSDQKAIARHEVLCTLEDIIKQASYLLCDGGQFYMIHRPHRLVDIVALCRTYHLEPKEIRMIQPYADKKPNIFLIRCAKRGKPDLKFQDPLIVYKAPGVYSDEIYKIYGMTNITSFTKNQEV